MRRNISNLFGIIRAREINFWVLKTANLIKIRPKAKKRLLMAKIIIGLNGMLMEKMVFPNQYRNIIQKKL